VVPLYYSLTYSMDTYLVDFVETTYTTATYDDRVVQKQAERLGRTHGQHDKLKRYCYRE
jgi:hypothetical protein